MEEVPIRFQVFSVPLSSLVLFYLFLNSSVIELFISIEVAVLDSFQEFLISEPFPGSLVLLLS